MSSPSSERLDTLRAVFRGALSEAEAAQRLGVDAATLRTWCELLVEHAGSEARTRRRRSTRTSLLAASAAAALLVSGGVAWAQTTCTPGLQSNGLYLFCPGSPAVASQINDNFAQLYAWMRAKLGDPGQGAVTIGSTASPSSLTVTGPTTQQGNVTTTGTMTVNGDQTNNGALTVNGALTTTGAFSAAAYKTRIHRALGTTPVTLLPTAAWSNIGDMTVTFSLSARTTVDIRYQLAFGPIFFNAASRVLLDGTELPETRDIVGSESADIIYMSLSGSALRELDAGSHTVQVQYRSPSALAFNTSMDWPARALTVHVLGQ